MPGKIKKVTSVIRDKTPLPEKIKLSQLGLFELNIIERQLLTLLTRLEENHVTLKTKDGKLVNKRHIKDIGKKLDIVQQRAKQFTDEFPLGIDFNN